MKPLEWSTVSKPIKELIPTDRNPRKINAEGRRKLEEKIRTLGLFEIPSTDHNGELLNFNRRLEILLDLGRGDEMIDVRIPNRPLTDEERKQIIVSSNTHEGDWDLQQLYESYSDIDLSFAGIEADLLKQMDEQQSELEAAYETGEQEKPEPVYPVVPTYSEKHTAFVIVCDNEIDETFLTELLGLETAKCYKSQRTGVTHVIRSKDFIQKCQNSQ